MSFTFKQLLDNFDVEFGEIVPQSMPVAYKKKLINMGQSEVARKTKCLDSVYTTNTVDGTQTYGLTSEMAVFSITKVTWDGAEMSPLLEPAHTTESGSPYGYYMLEGTLGLKPAPNQAKVLKVFSIEVPPDMTTDSQLSPLPAEYHHLMKDYALWKAFLAFHKPQEAEFKRRDFLEGVGELKEDMTSDQLHEFPCVQNVVSGIM